MKKFLITLVSISFLFQLSAQSRFEEEGENEEKQPAKTEETKPTTRIKAPARKTQTNFWDRTRFGGNFGLGFSNVFSYVNVSPRMYYLATEKLWLGAGLTFIWSRDNRYIPPYDEQFVYGLNLSAQYMLFGPVFLQAEYEPLSYERVSINSSNEIVGEERVWIHGVLLGGGISQRVGRGMMFVSILYNVTWSNDRDSYYYSPWVFRIGIGI